MEYNHTQHGRWHYFLLTLSIAMSAVALFAGGEMMIALLIPAIAIAVVMLTFVTLTVSDKGQYLALRYGPIPLLHKRIRYDQITAVAPDRTKLIDGFGIHYVPLRGWTYNLWGFDCVRLTLGDKTIRIGTDDRDNLVEYLESKMDVP